MSMRFLTIAASIAAGECYATYVEPLPAELHALMAPLGLVALAWLLLWPRNDEEAAWRKSWDEQLELNRYSFGGQPSAVR